VEEDFLKDVKRIVIISCNVDYLSRSWRSGGCSLTLVRFVILLHKLQFDQNTRNRTTQLKLEGQGGK
jgi:hypothetical protein